VNNPLDQIYANYKKGIRPGQSQIPAHDRRPQRISPGSHGVPNPLLEGELQSDNSNITACPKCNSFNISLDMATNKINCNDCKSAPEKPTKVNFEKQMTDLREQEMRDVEDRMKLGEQFFV
jgi:hypothetical protein